jgi:hypothetical protein
MKMSDTGHCACLGSRKGAPLRVSDKPLGAAVDRFVDRENIERYRTLASESTGVAERLRILKLLADERAAFKLEFQAAAAKVRVPDPP